MKTSSKASKKIQFDDAMNAALEALVRYNCRSGGRERPTGKFDGGGRWYPAASEKLDESSFRSPSREWPYSYLRACCSLAHCERLHNADHHLVLMLRRELKNSNCERPFTIAQAHAALTAK